MAFAAPPLRVRLSRPDLAPELAEALGEGDCFCVPVDDETVLVLHRAAADEVEARTELTFFLRAWQGRHAGVRAEVLGR
jgi:hypothetical protein